MSETTAATTGRWHAILPALGVQAKFLTGKNGPCPFCGGKDRWRFLDTKGKGTWFCTHCGSGNGFEIVKRILGVEYPDAVRAVENVVRTAPPARRPNVRDDEALRKAAARAWHAAEPLCDGDPAVARLRSRAIDLPGWPEALRYAPGAMLGKIVDSDGRGVNVHRTFLPSGPKKYMAGRMPPGSAIRLMPHVGILGVAEGIETALSVYLLFGVPCWAAGDAGHVASFAPPPDVRALCFYADNDANFVGQLAAYNAARRLEAKGLSVAVKVPDDVGTDWNDVLRQRGAV